MNEARFKPAVLIILDGWGYSQNRTGNAILSASLPHYDSYWQQYPHTLLEASGEAVGLPKGEDGNTETGHINLGAGQIVYQDLPRINQAIADGSFFKNQIFKTAFNHTAKFNSTLHLMGLIGSGGVHSNIEHLYALLRFAAQEKVVRVALHLFTDGRDSPPTSAINYLNLIYHTTQSLGLGFFSTIMGRYYAMDRDHRWDRTEVAYKALTEGVGELTPDWSQAILSSYQNQVTDEFLKPIIICDSQQKPRALIQDNDAVIFFNFRIDRPRQLTKAFVFPNFEYLQNQPEGFDPYAINYHKSHLAQAPHTTPIFHRPSLLKNLLFVTMTEYEKGLPASSAFPPIHVDNPLSQVIADLGLRQLKMAETEKERFVTYYFNGLREDAFPGEDRIIIPSPSVSTYDQTPGMSAESLTQTLVERIHTNLYDFIVVNYAHPDMVAHTGNFQAAVTAASLTDNLLASVIEATLSHNGLVAITADHGNIEEMINLQTGAIDTEHSQNPVPLILIAKSLHSVNLQLPQGILADVAPTMLKLLNLPIPKQMSGRTLI